MFIHKAIHNAVRRPLKTIIVDVTLNTEWSPTDEPWIQMQDRGRDYVRVYTFEEIRSKIKSGGTSNPECAAGEGTAYRHVYFCTSDVPADISSALAGDVFAIAAE